MVLYERSETYAALDLGTTNCRLLIARRCGDSLKIVDSFSRIVRLGEGVEASGKLSEPAMQRTLDALTVCANKVQHRQVTYGRFVATEACRRASNCNDFLGRVHEATGLRLEIIATSEEARLALAGCAPLLDARDQHALVFDIGGGSTEVLWVGIHRDHQGRATTEVRGVVSVPFGVVSLTERFVKLDGKPDFAGMIETVRAFLRPFDKEWGIRDQIRRGGVQMLGSSGTVTTLAGIHMGLTRYDRARVDGVELPVCALRRVADGLVEMEPSERALQPCVGPSRADLMVAGCAILEAICGFWPILRIRIADRGVREGILAGLMGVDQIGHHRGVATW